MPYSTQTRLSKNNASQQACSLIQVKVKISIILACYVSAVWTSLGRQQHKLPFSGEYLELLDREGRRFSLHVSTTLRAKDFSWLL